ncbi:hypothetical protein ACP70R_042401 [Stipagrostis hirtigluma subsp. patula]
MPRLTPADATLILDHVLGDPSVPAAAARALLAALPTPSRPTPRLRRAVLLRRLAEDPVSASSLDTLHLLASLPSSSSSSCSSSPSPTPAAKAHLAVAAFLAASAPDFDAAARALFACPGGRARRAVEGEGGCPALASAEFAAVAGQFEAAVGNAFAQAVLKGLYDDRATAEERVRELLSAEWTAIGPSLLEAAAERIVGEGAVEAWRAADEATRAKYRVLAGEEQAHEVLCKLQGPSRVNPILTPAVEKVVNALKTSCADLHSVVEDPLPAAKIVADQVLATRMDKAVNVNTEEVSRQQANCGVAGPSTLNDKGKPPNIGGPSLMDWNPTAQTYQWEDSPDSDGSRPPSNRPHLASPRRIPVSPLRPPENQNRRRRKRRWSVLEEETLRKGVEEYGSGNWKDILANNSDVFIGRTYVDLKDKWRNMVMK